MSTFPGSQITGCPNLQASLNDFYNNGDPSRFMEDMPIHDFLYSDLNRTGVRQSLQSAISPGRGKTRTIELVYNQRIPESQVENVSSCDTTCTATNETGDGYAQYEIDTCDHEEYTEKVNAEDFKNSCKDNAMQAMERIARGMDAVVRKNATRLTNRVLGLYGNWASDVSGVTGKTLALDLGTINAPKPSAEVLLDTALMQTGYIMPPVIFAGTSYYNFMKLLNIGCCNTSGQNLLETLNKYRKAVMYDTRLQAQGSYGATGMLIVQPGALQPIWFNRHAGKRAMQEGAGITSSGSNYETMTLIHPRTGVPVDILMKDDCGQIHMVFSVTTDVVAMPNDMFPAGDRMVGVNWINKASGTFS